MNKTLYFLLLLFAFSACEKYPGPSSEIVESFSYGIMGDNQSRNGAGYLPLEVGAHIDFFTKLPDGDKTFKMEIDVSPGNGTVDNNLVHADSEGKMLTKWHLGNDRNKHRLSCRILDDQDNVYAIFTLNANAFFDDQLNEISSGLLVGIRDMVYDTVNNYSLLLSSTNLYINTGTKFDQWSRLPSSSLPGLKEIEINSEGDLFGAAYNGHLYRSANQGLTWENLGQPIPGNQYHYELSITKDDYIWANKWEKGMYCSKDNGQTWIKDESGLPNQEEMGRIFAFSDSSHLAVSYSNSTVKRTDDGGLNWYPINTPEYPQSMFVTRNNDIIVQHQAGFKLRKSSDGGNSYHHVFTTSVAFGTTSKRCFQEFEDNYYVLAPGGGVWRTKDFEHFEQLLEFRKQRYLFIDHNGTLYASGFKYSNEEDDPTLVLPRTN